VLGIGENLCAKEGDDVIRDYRDGLVAEVIVVDTQLGVKPVDFVRDEFSGDETLRMGLPSGLRWWEVTEIAYLGRDLDLNLGSLFFFAFEDGGGVPGEILQFVDGRVTAAPRDPGGGCG
jgi:hypothetical protein